ncbi:hypothetical protein AAMO2058_001462900 [Amorphochlora amoebiformis]
MSQTTFPAMGAALVAGAISVWVIDRFSTHIAPLREAFARRWASSTANPVHPSIGLWKTLLLLHSYSWELIWWLRAPGLWLFQLLRLVLFTVFMLPGFIPPFLFYLFSHTVRKNIPYGKRFRQQLDVYLPYEPGDASHTNKKYPVVVFITGGAWTIGYKVWGFIMGQLFQKNGVICVAPDYRNFPQGSVNDMIDDIENSIGWVIENIESFGGDLDQISLVGQSAGAHLSALMLLHRVAFDVDRENEGDNKKWDVSRIKHWVGVSGPYDIVTLTPTLHNRGFHKRIFSGLFTDPKTQSPLHFLYHLFSPPQTPKRRGGKKWIGRKNVERLERLKKKFEALPQMHLFHGTSDDSVPYQQSEKFAAALMNAGVHTETTLFPGKSHTDPILEDPVTGDDPLMIALLRIAKNIKSDQGNSEFKMKCLTHVQPSFMLKIARFCNPF